MLMVPSFRTPVVVRTPVLLTSTPAPAPQPAHVDPYVAGPLAAGAAAGAVSAATGAAVGNMLPSTLAGIAAAGTNGLLVGGLLGGIVGVTTLELMFKAPPPGSGEDAGWHHMGCFFMGAGAGIPAGSIAGAAAGTFLAVSHAGLPGIAAAAAGGAVLGLLAGAAIARRFHRP